MVWALPILLAQRKGKKVEVSRIIYNVGNCPSALNYYLFQLNPSQPTPVPAPVAPATVLQTYVFDFSVIYMPLITCLVMYNLFSLQSVRNTVLTTVKLVTAIMV